MVITVFTMSLIYLVTKIYWPNYLKINIALKLENKWKFQIYYSKLDDELLTFLRSFVFSEVPPNSTHPVHRTSRPRQSRFSVRRQIPINHMWHGKLFYMRKQGKLAMQRMTNTREQKKIKTCRVICREIIFTGELAEGLWLEVEQKYIARWINLGIF